MGEDLVKEVRLLDLSSRIIAGSIMAASACVLLLVNNTIVLTIGLVVAFFLIGNQLLGFAVPKEGSRLRDSIGLRVLVSTIAGFSLFAIILIPFSLLFFQYRTTTIIALVLAFLVAYFVGRIPFKSSQIREPVHLRLGTDLGLFGPLLVGIALAVYLRSLSPYPQIPGWDIFNHMYLVQYTIHLNGIYALFVPYPVAFHIGLAGIAQAVESGAFDLFWFGIFLTVPIFSITCYFLYTSFGVSAGQASMGAMVTTLFSGLAQSLGPNYLVPSTTGLILTLLLVIIMREIEIWNASSLALACIVAVYSAIMYYYTIVILFPLIYQAVYPKLQRYKVVPGPILVSLIAATVVAFGAYILREVSGPDTISRFPFLLNAWTDVGPFLFIASALGVLLLRRSHVDATVRDVQFGLSFYSLMLLLIFLTPDTASVRVELYLRVLAGFFIVLPLGRLVSLPSPTKAKIIAAGVVILIVLHPLPLPYSADIARFSNVGSYTNILPQEYQAIQWLVSQTHVQNAVLTDPATARIIEGVGFRYGSDELRVNETTVMDFFHTYQQNVNQSLTLQSQGQDVLIDNGISTAPVSLSITSTDIAVASSKAATGDFKMYGNRELAQTFLVTSSNVSGVILDLRAVGTIDENANLTVQLRATDFNMIPDSTVIAQTSFSLAFLRSSYTSVKLSLNAGALNPNSPLALVMFLDTSFGNSENFVGVQGDVQNVYDNGTAFFQFSNNGPWTNTGGDLVFQILSPPRTLINPSLSLDGRSLDFNGTLIPGQELDFLSNGTVLIDGDRVGIFQMEPSLDPGPNTVYFENNGGQGAASIEARWTEKHGTDLTDEELLMMLNSQIQQSTKGVGESFQYVFLSGRTAYWSNGGIPSQIEYAPPRLPVLFQGTAKFSTGNYSLIYSNDYVSIYKIQIQSAC
jgi:hypothetical protein